jgi:hypothetical protein
MPNDKHDTLVRWCAGPEEYHVEEDKHEEVAMEGREGEQVADVGKASGSR